MSGSKPIEFVKTTTKEGGKEETPTGSDSKLPLTKEVLMSDKEKDAAALQRVAAAFGSASETKVESAPPGPQHIASEAGGDGLTKPESMAYFHSFDWIFTRL